MVKTTNQQKSALCQPKMMELMEHHRFSSAKRQYTELENGYGYWGYQWDKYPFFILIYPFSSPIPIANSGISVGNGLNKQMAYRVLVKSCGQQIARMVREPASVIFWYLIYIYIYYIIYIYIDIDILGSHGEGQLPSWLASHPFLGTKTLKIPINNFQNVLNLWGNMHFLKKFRSMECLGS